MKPRNLSFVPVYSVSWIRFNFRSQIKLLPQVRCLINFRKVSNVMSLDSNVTDNIIRKIINVE